MLRQKAKQLNRTSNAVSAAIAIVAIAGCGGNAASPPGSTTVVQPASSKAQVRVGTANLFGTLTGMNVTATLRTPQGKSVLVSTPTLTGPFVLPGTAGTPDGVGSTYATGPSTTEIARGGIISGTPQVAPGTPGSQIPPTTFGIRGGVFANGFFPGNANNRGNVFDTPYTEPAYDNGDPNAFTPWGGPPAFDPNGGGQGTRDGTFDPSVLGVSEGINAFAGVTVNPGAYSLSVLIPTNTAGTQPVITASTTLGAVTALGPATAPTYVPDGLGGGTFAVTLPAGVTDALLNIEDIGPAAGGLNCYSNGTYPAYFTIHVTATGAAPLPDMDGVGSPTKHTPTICTAAQNSAITPGDGGDQILVQLIGADYPIYQSNYLFTLTQQLPNIGAGPNDITISPASAQTST